ncbi:hypothetical protein SPM50_04750 [Enterobacter hormaechei subsp. hoffmannii]
MTLDALYQLLKTVLPPDTDSADDLQDFMAMLMAKKHHSEALSPFSQRVYMLSVAHRDPKQAAALISACHPEAGSPFRCSTSPAGRTCATPRRVNYRRLRLKNIFTGFRLPPRYYAVQLLTLSSRKTRQHFIFWIRYSA